MHVESEKEEEEEEEEGSVVFGVGLVINEHILPGHEEEEDSEPEDALELGESFGRGEARRVKRRRRRRARGGWRWACDQ